MKTARGFPGPYLTKLFRSCGSDDPARAGLLDYHLVATHGQVVEEQLGVRIVADVDATHAAVITRSVVRDPETERRVVEADVAVEDNEPRHRRVVGVGVTGRDLGLDTERPRRGVLDPPYLPDAVIRATTCSYLSRANEPAISEEVGAGDVADQRRSTQSHLVDDGDGPALAPA